MERVVPKMPKEYYGETLKKTEYVVNTPRKWTTEEINWCLNLREQGFSTKEIAESVGRELTSVSIKLKRLTKKNDTYNKAHIVDKYETNAAFLNHLEFKTMLDVYCGVKSYWRNNSNLKVETNDIDESVDADTHMDSLKLMCKLYSENKKYDVIDLDPFGSAYDCFDLAIKMAKKGLIITLGEMGHKRFKRLDFVRRMYGINTLEEFTSDRIIEEIQKIGLKNKKILTVYQKKDWQGISRVWFTIDKYKITEQWD